MVWDDGSRGGGGEEMGWDGRDGNLDCMKKEVILGGGVVFWS